MTQWWLATRTRPRVARRPAAAGIVPHRATRVGRDERQRDHGRVLADPLDGAAAGLLTVSVAAAVLAITGFCVSIAAGVRQRRAENALLAALGVAPRAAAGQSAWRSSC